ncbi:MAG TPA: lysylphosphatidylglycerol synthase transmembrane domain-containing protein [Polyangiaceae bacterium]|nr:lysylphosphatidylglycerol synthase transmembrane domain-containing protein [Polyangiaceae bacterium]
MTKTAEKAPAASRAAVPPLSSPPAGAAEAPGVAAVPAPVAPAGTLLPKLALSLLLAGGFVWVLQRGGLPIMPPRSAFATVRWWLLGPYLLLCCVGMFLRTYRWIYLLRPLASQISSRAVFGAGLVGYAIVFFAPLRTGEVARPWLVARRREVGFLQAAGTVVAERIIDGVTLSLVLVMGLVGSKMLEPLPDRIGKLPVSVAALPAAAYGTLPVFGAAVLIMLAFRRWRAASQRLFERAIGVVSERFATWVIHRIEKLSDGLALLRPAQARDYLRDTVLYWFVMFSSNWVLLVACGLPAGPAEAAVIIGVTGMGSLVPSGPGFFGTFQLASYASLALFFLEPVVLGPGAAFTVLSYSSNVVLTMLSSLVGVAMMRGRPEH